MKLLGAINRSRLQMTLCAAAVFTVAVSCGPERIELAEDGPFPPGVDPKGEAVDGVEVGHRLIAASQYELAIDAFTRAALEQGMTPEIISGLGSANLGLGRLGQAEQLLRRAVKEQPDWPEAWNNLGVILMEQGKTSEAQQIFQKAFALDNGESDSIRDNLRLALAKSEKSDNTVVEKQEYKLVQRGSGDFLLRKNQD